jgi:hypothetical protein
MAICGFPWLAEAYASAEQCLSHLAIFDLIQLQAIADDTP